VPNGENPDRATSADQTSEAHLLEVYDELRQLAQYRMSRENGAQTLSATALVHEAWMRIAQGDRTGKWENQRHFFGAAAEAMRRILIDRARARNQLKRGGGSDRTELQESQVQAPLQDAEMLAVHEALGELEQDDSESAG
jgi:RNA polymerase sigma factor (TIGR02999 family)